MKHQIDATKRAIGILSAGDIKLSDFGKDILKRLDEGKLRYEQAKAEIIKRARENASKRENT